jgi:hypothetical protein
MNFWSRIKIRSAAFLLIFSSIAFGQRVAILAPDRSSQSLQFAERLAIALEPKFRVLDTGLAASAYNSLKIEDPFNLDAARSRDIGTIVGCDHFIILKVQNDRRSSSARPTYFEASAPIFLVNCRTGRLEHFVLARKQEDSATGAEHALIRDAVNIAAALSGNIKASAVVSEPSSEFEMFNPDSKDMRPAMPYKRIKPEYTNEAYLFNVKATVDAEVNIDETGKVRTIDIVRWAGFGLDEAVVEAVNKMNWRPGERKGRPLPMRVLLRYNFTKIDKE